MPINKSEVTRKIQLKELLGERLYNKFLKSENKESIAGVAGAALSDAIREELSQSRSPVKSGEFKRKKADGSSSRLFEEGDLYAAISAEPSNTSLKVGVFDSDQAPKAFNHQTGSPLPRRQILPSGDEEFKRSVLTKVRAAAREEINASQDEG